MGAYWFNCCKIKPKEEEGGGGRGGRKEGVKRKKEKRTIEKTGKEWCNE